MRRISLTPVILGGMMLAAASPLFAQKHGGTAAHPVPPGQMHAPATTRDARKAEKRVEHAQKEAMKDQKEMMKDQDKAAKERGKMEDRSQHDARKVAKRADKLEDNQLRHAFNDARHQDKSLTHGIRLTRQERARLRDIDRRYDTQLRALEKDMNASQKAGRLDDPTLLLRINTLRDQERAEIRAALTPAQQIELDRNISRIGSRR